MVKDQVVGSRVDRRKVLVALALLLSLASVVLVIVSRQSPPVTTTDLAGTRPNIVFIMTDDQGYGPVGAHGHPWIETPHLDALRAASTRLTCFQVCPTCSPTRAALMTGRHPLKSGVTHTLWERERMTLEAVTLGEVLGRAGYATGIFGKWHLGDEEAYQPHNRGFDEVFVHGGGGIGQAFDCSLADVPDNSYFDPVIRRNGKFVKTKGFCTDVFFSEAMRWIDSRRSGGEPFFAYISTNAPHAPFVAPKKDTKRFVEMGFKPAQAGFYGMVENIDDNVGRLMARLDEWGLAENTLVVFLSDNGPAGGAGRDGRVVGQTEEGEKFRAFHAGMKGIKGSPDEGGTRVPAFFCWRDRIPGDRDIDRLAAHIDILPTLAALAGVEPPQGQVEGRSLVPLLENPKAAWPDRFLFTQCARWPVGSEPNDFQWENFAIRNQRFRLVNNGELFDMQADPGQTTNVIDEHPEVVAGMRAAYDVFWKEARPLMVNESVPISPTRPYHVLYEKQQLAEGGIPAGSTP